MTDTDNLARLHTHLCRSRRDLARRIAASLDDDERAFPDFLDLLADVQGAIMALDCVRNEDGPGGPPWARA